MPVRLNFWAPDASWSDAYDAGLQPTSDPSDNQKYFYDVASVQVRQVATPEPGSLLTGLAAACVGAGLLRRRRRAIRRAAPAASPLPGNITWDCNPSLLSDRRLHPDRCRRRSLEGRELLGSQRAVFAENVRLAESDMVKSPGDNIINGVEAVRDCRNDLMHTGRVTAPSITFEVALSNLGKFLEKLPDPR